MKWLIRDKQTKTTLKTSFDDRTLAEQRIVAMGSAFVGLFEAVPVTTDKKLFRMLTEGLVAGDLRRIILPQISIDEYVPGDPDTDHVVIAFFIKGVPEAVIPFRDFVMRCKGVIDVAYGESDTIPNTSIVYAEMPRTKFKFEDLYTIMEQISLLTDLEVDDFSIMFPTSSKKFPYSPEVIQRYFDERSAKQNQQAQQAAFDAGGADKESTGTSEEEGEEFSKAEVEEALIESLANFIR